MTSKSNKLDESPVDSSTTVLETSSAESKKEEEKLSETDDMEM